MRVEVLVATMNRKNINFIEDMNIKSDSLIINQSNYNGYEEINKENFKIRMLSNNQRGLSRSRNQAILYSEADICLFADDDVVYENDYVETILKAFKELPDADIIVFETEMINYKGGIVREKLKKIRKAPKYKNYGSVRIAFRRESFIKNNIWFNLNFGAGSKFKAGEETLVLRDANRKGMKIYEYPLKIAKVDYSESTWFEGYNEKYFYDKGAFLAVAYPKLKYILKYYYIYKFRNVSQISIRKAIYNMRKGYLEYKNK